VCDYPTPYGTLQLYVEGIEVRGSIKKSGDKLFAEYNMLQGEGDDPINNKLYISVK